MRELPRDVAQEIKQALVPGLYIVLFAAYGAEETARTRGHGAVPDTRLSRRLYVHTGQAQSSQGL